MTRIFSPLLLLIFMCSLVNAQKDCSHDNTGLIPIPDLGLGTYRGFTGGLYPDGSNVRPTEYLAACIEHVQNIQPLDIAGNADEDGRIVMLGIGASNPGAEFNKFIEISNYFEPRNDKLSLINGCVPSIGIQDMNYTASEYWGNVMNILEENDLSADQVQIVWIEEENTAVGDTAFPSAAQALVTDFHFLLQAIKIMFPNTQICYVTARAYSGYADPGTEDLTNGLKFPRDYYNGWGLKWFIENVINHELGYTYEGPSAEIPLVTWGTYHWTDGSVERMDGLLLDCEEDVAPDGLHLSGSGEIKMGQLMLNYFIADTTAKYWFFDEEYTGIYNNDKENSTLNIFPNPVLENQIHIQADDFNSNEKIGINIFSIDGKQILSLQENYSDNMTVLLPELNSGLYMITIYSENAASKATFIINE